MTLEFLNILRGWLPLDSWMVLTAALAAMACALPGNFLVLRRQSMMGDALSHTALLGVVAAFLLAHQLQSAGWIGDTAAASRTLMFAGAVVVGVLTALLTEALQKLGGVESSAALGVVFTSLFALGLTLIRATADSVHLDLDCVFFGLLESAAYPAGGVPQAVWTNGGMLAVNLTLLLVFYKELKISTFDPALATALGINAAVVHYLLMAVTAVTLVAAFESVGSILVIAMLIAPPATASLLAERLSTMIALSLLMAALSALLGHVLAITLPPIVLGRLGFPTVLDAGTTGMMAVVCGLLFLAAMLLAPRRGVVSQVAQRIRLSLRIAAEDLLGAMYRHEERQGGFAAATPAPQPGVAGIGPLLQRLARRRLTRKGRIVRENGQWRLTDSGRESARQLIRSHRLWETYVARHFDVPEDHLHATAERIEHFLDSDLREELATELDRPLRDPQGKSIPPETHDQPEQHPG